MKEPSTETFKMKQNRSFAALISVGISGTGAALAHARFRAGDNLGAGWIGGGAFALALVGASAIQVADQWTGR
jgi:hypothetical protein